MELLITKKIDMFNLQLPNKNQNNKFQELDSWFDFMNDQFKKIKESKEKSEINNLLIDNDINLIK